MIASIRMGIFSPLMFRASGEFSPMARGPQTMAKSLLFPIPSTLVGCVATALGGRPTKSVDRWEEGVLSALGLEDGFFRGPYLLVDEVPYVEARLAIRKGSKEGIIRVKDLIEFLRQVDIFSVDMEEVGEELEKNWEKIIVSVRRVERVGIGLKAKEKVVDEEKGLFYAVNFVDYGATFPYKQVKLAIDVHGADLSSASGKIVRLGGEGKPTRIEVGSAELWKTVDQSLEELGRRTYLYLITYLLIEKLPMELGAIENGVFCWPDFVTPLKELVKTLSGGRVMVERVKGSIELLGTGFDLARKVRKPIYPALTPGSILEVRTTGAPKDTIRELYLRGLSARGSKLGYGTFIPIPTE